MALTVKLVRAIVRSLVITVKLLFIEHTLGNLPSDFNNNHIFLN